MTRTNRAHKVWTETELRHLRGLLRMRCSARQIATFFGRTEAAIRRKVSKLGLTFRQPPLPKSVNSKRRKDRR